MMRVAATVPSEPVVPRTRTCSPVVRAETELVLVMVTVVASSVDTVTVVPSVALMERVEPSIAVIVPRVSPRPVAPGGGPAAASAPVASAPAVP